VLHLLSLLQISLSITKSEQTNVVTRTHSQTAAVSQPSTRLTCHLDDPILMKGFKTGAKRKRRAIDALEETHPPSTPIPPPPLQSSPKKKAKADMKHGGGTAAAEDKRLLQHACPFAKLPSWGLEVGDVDGDVGSITASCVAKHTREQGHTLPFRHAVHVVNPILESAYERKKEELVLRLGVDNVNERFLFHGTSFIRSKAIIRSNFSLTQVLYSMRSMNMCV